MWREQAITEWSHWMISIVVCCHSGKLCTLAARAFWSNTRNILPSLLHAQYIKMTRYDPLLGFGFTSCDISIYWWIWVLSFLLKQICIGIYDILLNFFVTFASVLGVQVTVWVQFNSGLQPPTRWESFVAGTMLPRLDQSKESVEPPILSIIAIEITHLTRFTLLLLLRIQRYVWCSHVITCT